MGRNPDFRAQELVTLDYHENLGLCYVAAQRRMSKEHNPHEHYNHPDRREKCPGREHGVCTSRCGHQFPTMQVRVHSKIDGLGGRVECQTQNLGESPINRRVKGSSSLVAIGGEPLVLWIMSSAGSRLWFQMLLDGRNEVAMVSFLCQVNSNWAKGKSYDVSQQKQCLGGVVFLVVSKEKKIHI